MMRFSPPSRQRGVSLVVALILLAVLTLISLYVAATGGLELRMARNMQESEDSFQSAEAGVAAVLRQVRGGPDPFRRQDVADPLAGVTPNPLAALNDGAAAMDLNVVYMAGDTPCPRVEEAYSADLIVCDHYRVESRHDTDDARTKVDQGVVKPVIGSASP